jgi:DNA-binding transcriptional MerR regulator
MRDVARPRRRGYARGVDKGGLIPIGRFAKLTDLTAKLLRKLDERGVLSPAYVDPETRYRYYEAGQTRVAALVHLGRQLDLPIGEITELVAAGGGDELRRRLKAHRERLAAKLNEQTRVLRLLDQELARDGRIMAFDIGIKEEPETLVASARGSLPRTHPHDPWALEAALLEAGERVVAHLATLGEEPDPHPIIVYHSDMEVDEDLEFEVCFPITRRLPEGPDVACGELPAALLAFTTFLGAYDTIWSAFLELRAWVAENGFVTAGTARERGLVTERDTPDTDHWVTELAVALAG